MMTIIGHSLALTSERIYQSLALFKSRGSVNQICMWLAYLLLVPLYKSLQKYCMITNSILDSETTLAKGLTDGICQFY